MGSPDRVVLAFALYLGVEKVNRASMTEIHFTLLNLAHGGGNVCGRVGLQTSWDLEGAVEILRGGSRWPHVLVLLEAEQWDRAGGDRMRVMTNLLNAATEGTRVYAPMLGSLTHNRGPEGPCVFVDLSAIAVQQWHDGSAPDFYEDARNRLFACLVDDDPADVSRWFRVRPVHLCPRSPTRRQIDAELLTIEGNPLMAAILPGDYNSTLSGPGWEITDLADPGRDRWRTVPHIDFRQERSTGQVMPNTDPLDLLCGWWEPDGEGGGRRVGGAGLASVAEIVGNQTPTKPPNKDFKPSVTSHMLVNSRWVESITHYGLIDPLDRTDHMGVEVSVEH